MTEPESSATASVEQVLFFIDRQIEAVLRFGALAVESDLHPEGRPDAAVLRDLPVGIWSALVTEVGRRGRYTVVKTRFMTISGGFTLVTAWDLGPEGRPWVVRIAVRHRTLDHAAAARSGG